MNSDFFISCSFFSPQLERGVCCFHIGYMWILVSWVITVYFHYFTILFFSLYFPRSATLAISPRVSSNDLERRGLDRKGTTTIVASEQELMLITEESELNLASDETTWVVDSGASFHLTPDRKCFSSYTAGDHGCVRMGNEGTCRIVGIGDVMLMT